LEVPLEPLLLFLLLLLVVLTQETAHGRENSLINSDAVGDHVRIYIIVPEEALVEGLSFAIGAIVKGNGVFAGCDKGLDLNRTFKSHTSTSSDNRGLVTISPSSEQTDNPDPNWNRR
jgi:hypothetical protein